MGSKNKLKRFRENETFPNLVQPDRDTLLKGGFALRGRWGEGFFKNANPIVLELGCGRGEYTLALAEKQPDKNFIGIDIKGARLWRGAKTALQGNLTHVGFIRTQIALLDKVFAPDEVSEIWLTFPDPQLKYRRTKLRLTNQKFLELYRNITKPGAPIHLKTDSEFLHGYTLGILQGLGCEITYAHHDIYNNPEAPKEVTSIQTYYEKQFLEQGKKITYLQFKL